MLHAKFEIPRSYIDWYFQLSDSVGRSLRVYPLAPFLRIVQIMALVWSKHGPNMVSLIGFSWVLNNIPGDASTQIWDS